MKMVYYEIVKVTNNAFGLVEIILEVVVQHYGLRNSIVSDLGLVIILKFWLLLYYFFGIKRRLFTAFHPQIDGQTKRQNSTIEAYLRAFVNYKQDN